jgi:hypothetical protein
VNSIDRSLNAGTIVATARMLRSAKKEIILIVEGDDDIALFSNSMSLPRSNFISCRGKGRLMEVFDLVPHVGLDSGTILLRDSDFDAVESHRRDDVLLLVSDRYDLEMSLIPGRVFGRIFSEFMKTRSGPELTSASFERILAPASVIGALRLLSYKDGLSLDFEGVDYSFINAKALTNDVDDMIRHVFARSRVPIVDRKAVAAKLQQLVNHAKEPADITSGKDFLHVLSIALSRHFRCCNAKECTFETLSRMFRMTVTHDDIKELALYSILREHVNSSQFEWKGEPL